ncbi:MAG: hypothetical protein ICV83_23725 [Cytophagales bacterium]|nr:hypothetical protein [Cytophagales bacterium]
MKYYLKRIAQLLVIAGAVGGALTACDSTSARTNAAGAAPATGNKTANETANETAREVRGASPYAEIGTDEPPPKLFVDPPLPEGLAQGIVWIQWRVENLNVVPVFGKGATNISPRVGHLHVHVDDLGWWWADPSNVNTIDIAGLTEGPHKVRLELVNTNHEPFPGQSKTVTFTIPKGASLSLKHRH